MCQVFLYCRRNCSTPCSRTYFICCFATSQRRGVLSRLFKKAIYRVLSPSRVLMAFGCIKKPSHWTNIRRKTPTNAAAMGDTMWDCPCRWEVTHIDDSTKKKLVPNVQRAQGKMDVHATFDRSDRSIANKMKKFIHTFFHTRYTPSHPLMVLYFTYVCCCVDLCRER